MTHAGVNELFDALSKALLVKLKGTPPAQKSGGQDTVNINSPGEKSNTTKSGCC